MYKKVRIQNFMCLQDVTVELGPLTVFVGPNSCGKSAFFKGLTTFGRLLTYPLRGGKTGPFFIEGGGLTLDDVVTNQDSSLPIIFDVWLDDPSSPEPDYSLELRRDYAGWGVFREAFTIDGEHVDTSRRAYRIQTSIGPQSWQSPAAAPLAYLTYPFRNDRVARPQLEPIQAIRTRLGRTRRFRPSASDIAAFMKPNTSGRGRSEAYVDEAGKGLPLVLRDLLATDRTTFQAIESGLTQLHDHVTGINFKSDWRGVGLMYSTTRAPGDTPAGLESDGVLLSTFLLWLIHTAEPNLILCLEEPENGVHIAAMRQRYSLLKSFATGGQELDPPQILVATHSRDFLNAIGTHPGHLQPSRPVILEEVRVVEFSQGVGTQIQQLDGYRQIKELLDEVRDQMGDLWWSGRLGPDKQQ